MYVFYYLFLITDPRILILTVVLSETVLIKNFKEFDH